MNDVFLKAYHGGLGDALQFSTLPEEFYKQEGRKTYIVEDAPFRNQEIYDLVWGKNPYVLGKKEGEWIEYWTNGQLRSKGTYNNGKKEGLWKSYDENGIKTKYAGLYKNGKKASE